MPEVLKIQCCACKKITKIPKFEPQALTWLDKLIEHCVRFYLQNHPTSDKHIGKKLVTKCVHCEKYLLVKV